MVFSPIIILIENEKMKKCIKWVILLNIFSLKMIKKGIIAKTLIKVVVKVIAKVIIKVK